MRLPDTAADIVLADSPGGLGLHIVNECMDRLEYNQAEDGANLLTMVKRLDKRRGRQ